MKPTIYIETSVIGYLTSRIYADPLTAYRQRVTRKWWDSERDRINLVVSSFVRDEAQLGDREAAKERLAVLVDIESIEPEKRANDLSAKLIAEVPLPTKASVDAGHISIAAVNAVDYLLTWNLRHIANVVLRDRIEQVCRKYGYQPPLICTPDDLLGGWL